jgi:hypothetical protein
MLAVIQPPGPHRRSRAGARDRAHRGGADLRDWIGREPALSRRAWSAYITLCTVTLLVCAVIVILSRRVPHLIPVPVALTFIAAMLAFFVGLLAFLREVLMATASLRIGPRDLTITPP